MAEVSGTRIHATALIDPAAQLGEGVEIGPYSIVHAGVRLGAGSFVGAHCELGLPLGGARAQAEVLPLQIGPHATIRSGTVLYAGSHFGARLETGHRVTIREHTVAGENLRVGTLSDIQGDCTLGDFVRLHGNVQVGKGSRVGSFVWIFPFVVLTNDPHPPSQHCIGVTLEDFAVVGAHCVLLPGVHLGRECVVGAGSLVDRDVAEGLLATGRPAKALCRAAIVRDKRNPAQRAYPWKDVFDRGLPWQGEGYAAWRERHPDAMDTTLEM
jgi:acetyltransferase-like isoleucine patch superfamily enzyme